MNHQTTSKNPILSPNLITKLRQCDLSANKNKFAFSLMALQGENCSHHWVHHDSHIFLSKTIFLRMATVWPRYWKSWWKEDHHSVNDNFHNLCEHNLCETQKPRLHSTQPSYSLFSTPLLSLLQSWSQLPWSSTSWSWSQWQGRWKLSQHRNPFTRCKVKKGSKRRMTCRGSFFIHFSCSTSCLNLFILDSKKDI